MRQKPDCLQRNIIAKSKLFTIEQMQLKFANGVERTYERIMHGNDGAVIIVPVTKSNTLLLVREYAAGINDYELAFAKGLIEPNEKPLEAANRELREEIGFAANKLTSIKTLTLAPGYFGARVELIVAQDLYKSPLIGDEPEPIEVIEWPLSQWEELLSRHDFTEARSIASLYLVIDWLKKQKEIK